MHGNAISQCDDAVRVSPVNAALDALDRQLSALAEEVARNSALTERITTPESAAPAGGIQSLPPTTCQLESHINGYADRVRITAARLSSINDRIQL